VPLWASQRTYGSFQGSMGCGQCSTQVKGALSPFIRPLWEDCNTRSAALSHSGIDLLMCTVSSFHQ